MLFDWSRKLAPPSQPIRCKLKPIAPWSLAFSRATGRLHAFTSSCHWLPLIISFTLIGRCDYFGFGFRHSIGKRSKPSRISPHKVLQSWLIITVYYLLVKNNKGRRGGLINFLPLKRGKGLIRGKGHIWEGGGGLNRGFIVCSLEKTRVRLHLFPFNVQLENVLYSTVQYHYC